MRHDSRNQVKRRCRRPIAMIAAALLIMPSLSASAQVSPEEHAKHHPEQAGQADGPAKEMVPSQDPARVVRAAA